MREFCLFRSQDSPQTQFRNSRICMSHFFHLIISENSGHHSDSILTLLETVCGLEERGGAQFVGLLPRANLPFYSTRAVASCKRCVVVWRVS